MTAAFGTLIRLGNGATPTEAFTTIAAVKDIEGPGMSKDSIETTNHGSAGRYKEFIPGLKDGGDVKFTIGYDPASASHAALQTQFDSDENNNWQLILPIPTESGFWGYEFSGHLTEISPKEPVEDELTADITIKISGKPTLSDDLTLA
jgi:predicted secreted protein